MVRHVTWRNTPNMKSCDLLEPLCNFPSSSPTPVKVKLKSLFNTKHFLSSTNQMRYRCSSSFMPGIAVKGIVMRALEFSCEKKGAIGNTSVTKCSYFFQPDRQLLAEALLQNKIQY